jgi:hypothetical protein
VLVFVYGNEIFVHSAYGGRLPCVRNVLLASGTRIDRTYFHRSDHTPWRTDEMRSVIIWHYVCVRGIARPRPVNVTRRRKSAWKPWKISMCSRAKEPRTAIVRIASREGNGSKCDRLEQRSPTFRASRTL